MSDTQDFHYGSGLFYKHDVTKAPPEDIFSVHTHTAYELLYFVGGDASYIIENNKYKLTKGDLVIVRPMSYHLVKIDSPIDYERYDILFDERDIGKDFVDLIPEGVEVVNLSKNRVADGIFKRLDYYRAALDGEGFARMLPMLIKELILNLSLGNAGSLAEFSAGNETVSAALGIINENLFTIEGIGEVAKKLFVSESYLYRIFKREMFSTPKKYINDKRLLAAREMIRIGESPLLASERCGYRDYSAFYRAYVKFFGHSPTEDRR